ncbi:MAG TPA: FAD-dependent oxidoreductase [Elusimicrobia bacterium]|nr:FAD-dependent oxidoreductase [Elusimicrobiota bacterium]
MERVDIAVVGAGVVGLAAAARLARPDRSVVVLESHARHGVETSSRNSEVIHAGLYYPPGSLKSLLCHEGRRRLYALAGEAGIFVRKTGKLVVAADPSEEPALERLRRGAEAAGAEGLRLLDGAETRRLVPGLRAAAALWSPETGILDSEELMRHLLGKATDAGAIFLFGSPLTAVERRPEGWVLTFGPSGERLCAPVVVNAAGLHSDRVAELAGIGIDEAGYRLHWCKGCYFRCRRPIPLPHLVYPVPEAHGLGVHLTPDREGRVRLGPDSAFVHSLDYDVDPALRASFHAAASRYWPGLAPEDLDPDTAGIRPKLSGPEGGFRDFVIAEESARGLPGWINLIGIESPGLTAALAIAERVAALAC